MGGASPRIDDACYWTAADRHPPHPALAGEIEADVAIIGAGVVGVIAARLLATPGARSRWSRRHASATG